MILSNKKLRLIIITLLLLIFCFFLGMFKPKASTYTYPIQVDQTIIPSNQFLTIDNIFGQTHGPTSQSGMVIFSFTVLAVQSGAKLRPINFLLLGHSDGTEATICDIGNSFTYSDSSVQSNSYTAVCRYASGFKFNRIEIGFMRTTQSQLTVDWSDGFTVLSDDSGAADYSNAISSINSNLNTLINRYNTQTNTIISKEDTMIALLQNIASNSTSITNIQNNTSDIKNNTSDIKDSLNDSSIDTNQATSSASTWNSKNTSNGTITQLLTLPITLLQAIVNGLQTSCSSFSLGSLFGTNISLPCIDLSSLIGSALFTTIDILFSGFMILSIAKKLIKIFNDFTNLKSNQIDELYGGGSK